MEQFQQDQLSDLNLQVDDEVRQHLNASAKWGRFISITVFVFCGLFLLMLLVGSATILPTLKNIYGRMFILVLKDYLGIIIAVFVFLLAIVAFIQFFLLGYSVKIKSALLNEDTHSLNKGLNLLKTYFIITTILSILVLLGNIYGLFR